MSLAAEQHDPGWEHAFVSEIFHDLSQPLTALQCALDLALRRELSLEQMRCGVVSALQSAERLRQRLFLIRAMNEAKDPGDLRHSVDLAELIRGVHQDMEPLFEAAGQKLQIGVVSGPVPVVADQMRIAQALFCLLEYLFRYSSPESVLTMNVRREGSCAEIEIDSRSCLPPLPSASGEAQPFSCEIEIARRSFRAAGGELILLPSPPGRCVWQASLPLS